MTQEAEQSLGDGWAVLLALVGVALRMEMLDTSPFALGVYVGNYLTALGLGCELDGLFANGAYRAAASFDSAQNSPALLVWRFRCGLTHGFLSAVVASDQASETKCLAN